MAAQKVVRAVVRDRLRVTLARPIPLATKGGKKSGYIDSIQLREGKLYVVGWTTGSTVHLSSDSQGLDVAADIPRPDLSEVPDAFGFEGVISGTGGLTVAVEDAKPLRIVVAGIHHEALAWLRMAGDVLALAVRNRKDIVGWFLRGDSQAGTRLEEALLPSRRQYHDPIAQAGIFAEEPGSAPVCHRQVDVIIPVHDAHDALAACLARVVRFTAPHHRTIVIDDASADPRIAPLLARFAAGRENVVLVANARNLGFVASVNLGLARSRGDVILLNSDAMVAEGWLDRIMAPILNDATVASVTPMTNNGEIASLPVICKAQGLQEGEVDRINAAACSLDPLKALAEVPTGVGFCMAMARSWLTRVPHLDEVFGRGYGEEVDWCRKVAAMGARHVLTGAAFVEHRGGMSFGAEKARRIAENNRIISRRHPDFDASVARFIGSDPAVGPRLALGLAAADRGAQAVPVYLAHRLGGGAEHWLTDEIATHLDADQSVAVLRDGDRPDSILFELHGPGGVTKGQVPLDEVPHYLAVPTRRRLVYSNLVGARAPLDLLARVVSALNPDDEFHIVFHDFLPLCPSYNLIGTDGRFCGLPDGPPCQRCYAALATTSGQRPATIAAWRQSWRRWMDRATGIVVFSEDSRRQVCRVWPDLAPRIEVVPHRLRHLPPRIAAPPPGRLTIGVLGGIGYSKGAKVLHDLASGMTAETDIVVIGKIDPDYTHPRITVHGPYDRSDIAALAERYRVGCWLIPSIWPETFSYAVHEALATGLPVFVNDLGAQAAAAMAARNGHLLPPNCTGAALERHLRAHASRGLADGSDKGARPGRTGEGRGVLTARTGKDRL